MATKSNQSSDSGIEADVDRNYRPLKIRVYRNGDAYDRGFETIVTRRYFKHWLTFLDYVTKRTNSWKSVHRLYTTDGTKVNSFTELKDLGAYVAVTDGPFIHCDYGGEKVKRVQDTSFELYKKPEPTIVEPKGLDSAESLEIYMHKQGYKSLTGAVYPYDGGSKLPRAGSKASQSIMLGGDLAHGLSSMSLLPHHLHPHPSSDAAMRRRSDCGGLPGFGATFGATGTRELFGDGRSTFNMSRSATHLDRRMRHSLALPPPVWTRTTGARSRDGDLNRFRRRRRYTDDDGPTPIKGGEGYWLT